MPYVVHDRVIEGYRPASGFFERGGLKTPEGCIEPPFPVGISVRANKRSRSEANRYGGVLWRNSERPGVTYVPVQGYCGLLKRGLEITLDPLHTNTHTVHTGA